MTMPSLPSPRTRRRGRRRGRAFLSLLVVPLAALGFRLGTLWMLIPTEQEETKPRQLGANQQSSDGLGPNGRYTGTKKRRAKPFMHGVASGDPTDSAVIIWTRVTTDNPQGDLSVSWKMALDRDSTSLKRIVASGSFLTNSHRDYTVKVDVTQLLPYTTYFYQFTYCYSPNNCQESVIGRTKTAPSDSTHDIQQLRFATVSCNSYQWGYFHAFDRIHERNDVDAVLHIGDYIYENAAGDYGDVREHEPPVQTVTLQHYRTRYAQYRLDRSLNDLHQRYAFITTWDDHEYTNNAWRDGALGHDPETQGPWIRRRRAASRAYREWLPFRTPEPNQNDKAPNNNHNNNHNKRNNQKEENTADPYNLYRKLSYGKLVDIFVLDNRIVGRDEQRDPFKGGQVKFLPNYYDKDHDLLGKRQMNWLKSGLSASTATWKVLVNPVVLAPVDIFGITGVNNDSWSGYHADRAELVRHIAKHKIDNVVFLSGDVHVTVSADIPLEKTGDLQTWTDWAQAWPKVWILGKKYTSVAVEFVTPSVTSITTIEEQGIARFPGGIVVADKFLKTVGIAANPHGKYVDTLNHGFQVIDFQPERVQQDIYFTGPPENKVDTAPPKGDYQTSFFSLSGENSLQPTDQASALGKRAKVDRLLYD